MAVWWTKISSEPSSGGDEAEALLGVEPLDLRGRAKAGEGSRERKPGKFTGAISFIAAP